ncbi:MAG: hypothetical protein FK730_10840 [Asgard group archaeon]|nr:hypothetical protein [Asgard group archaeon]
MRTSKFIAFFMIFLIFLPMFFSYSIATNNDISHNHLFNNKKETRSVVSSASSTFVSEYDHYYGYPDDYIVFEDIIYVIDRNLGISVYNTSNFQLEFIKYIEKEVLSGDLFDIPSTSYGYRLYKYKSNILIPIASDGILILNITNSLTLTPIYYIDGINVDSLITKDNLLYVLGLSDDLLAKSILFIYDIFNCSLPIEVSSFRFNTSYHSLTIQGNYLFLSDINDETTILDVSIAASPTSVVNISSSSYNLFVHEECLILSDMLNDKLLFYNITNISNPILIANLSISVHYSTSIRYFDGDIICISDGKTHVLNLTDIYNPYFQAIYDCSFYNLFNSEYFSWLNETKLSLKLIRYSLFLYNYTHYTVYNLVTTHYFDDMPRQIELVNNYAFVCSGSLIEIISIVDPTSPKLIGTYRIGGHIEDFLICNDLLLIASNSYGLVLLNVSDYSNPSFISRLECLGWKSLSIAYNYEKKIAYLGDYSNLAIVNLTDPSYPKVLTTFSTNRVEQIIYDNDILYTCELGLDFGIGDLNIYDVSDNTNPLKIVTLDVGIRAEMYLKDQFLYLSSEDLHPDYGFNPLTILDVSIPEKPLIIYHYNDVWFMASEFLIDNNILYVCSSHSLFLFDIHYIDSIQVINLTSDFTYPYPYSIAKKGNYLYLTENWKGLRMYQIEFSYSEITLSISQSLIVYVLTFLLSVFILNLKANFRRRENF